MYAKLYVVLSIIQGHPYVIFFHSLYIFTINITVTR